MINYEVTYLYSKEDNFDKKLITIELEVISMTGVEVIVLSFIVFAFLNQ